MVVFIVEPKEKSKVKRVVVVGLSRRNINLLLQGKPVILRAELEGKTVLPPGLEMCITFGETEEDIVKEISAGGFINAETEIVDRRKGGQHN
jgi:hypothetical protein